jgi:hypothetical protein
MKQPQEDFRIAIRKTAPCFVPQFRNKPASEGPGRHVVMLSDASPPRSAFVPSRQPAENHARPPFLVGEEERNEVGLNDGKKIFIDDVLESAEWCVPWLCSVNLTHSKPSD